MGAPLCKEVSRAKAFKAIEPESKIIGNYGTESAYATKFFDKYVDKKEQPHDGLVCLFNGCNQKFSHACHMRTHYMRHFNKSYDKYKCERCGKNYDAFTGLKDHVKNSKCKLTSDFPLAKHFIDKLLAAYPQQGRKAIICFKCGKDTYKSPYECQMHVLSCVHMDIQCIKCGRGFVAYPNARKHYEECKNDGKDTKKANFIDKVKAPTDDDEKYWTYAMMRQYMREHTVEKLEALFNRFPKGALGIIGMAGNPINRFTYYRNFPQIYHRSEANPYLDNDELILFRCWSRQHALMYEYLLQRHTILPDGELYKQFGLRMNQQQVAKPKLPASEKKAHYVYFQATRQPFTFANKHVLRSNVASVPLTTTMPSQSIVDSLNSALALQFARDDSKTAPIVISDDD